MKAETIIGGLIILQLALISLVLLWSATNDSQIDREAVRRIAPDYTLTEALIESYRVNQTALDAARCIAAGGALVQAYRGYACVNRRLP